MKRIFFILLGLSLFASMLHARKVSGSVRCEGLPLAEVIVTDGTNFTRTGANGKFKFNINDDARFVYIVTPSGYTADYSSGIPEFYRVAEGVKVFDFDLSAVSPSRDFTLFAVSDPQIRNREQFVQFTGEPLQSFVEQAAKSRDKGPVAAVVLGDIAWDAMKFHPEFKEAVKALGIPVYTVIGNHDYDRNETGRKTVDNYCRHFGPLNHAFFLGDDLVIGVENILYETDRKYEEGYSGEVLAFMKNLLAFIPRTTHIFIAQHSPLYHWSSGRDIAGADEMLALLEGYKVDFLSGHTHIHNNLVYSDDIMDHNVASICGSWWKAKLCNDGTPRGFGVFSSEGGKLSWHYHPIDHDEDFQMKVIMPGQSRFHPNDVILNVWDYDPAWQLTWFEDGVEMGEMEEIRDVDPDYIREINAAYAGKEIPGFRLPRKNVHYFAARPGQYAKKVTLLVRNRSGREWRHDVDMSGYVDVQAHRGGAGMMPENTISAFDYAIDLGVNTLELDLQLSSDGQVVVSHDAYFHYRYAVRPDGSEVRKGDPKEYLYTMPYDSIARYEVGLRPSSVWPEKANVSERKPLAADVIDHVERTVAEKGLSPMRYNIEIKSREGAGEGKDWPEYREFADKCLEVLLSRHLGDRLVVQSFDLRVLAYIQENYPDIKLSLLVDSDIDASDAYEYMIKNFKVLPAWISPHHSLVTEEVVARCHAARVKVVPWTVDAPEDIKRVLGCGVDAIISNYPHRVLLETRGY